MQTCAGKTKAGAGCGAAAGPGGLCFFHANPDSAKTLGRIGGRRNRRATVLDLQIPGNMTAGDVRSVIAQAIRLLLSGELKARDASALAQLCNSLNRAIPVADLEGRLKALEDQVEQEAQADPPDYDPTRSPNEGIPDGPVDAQEEAGPKISGPIDDATAEESDSAGLGGESVKASLLAVEE
jgi:hypothetical protein